jgi:hypothetical protein
LEEKIMAKKDKNLIWIILIILFILFLFLYSRGPSTVQDEDSEKEQEVVQPEASGDTCLEFPDFSGTPREGEPCIDTLDCENHPPIGYSGGTLKCVGGECEFEC